MGRERVNQWVAAGAAIMSILLCIAFVSIAILSDGRTTADGTGERDAGAAHAPAAGIDDDLTY